MAISLVQVLFLATLAHLSHALYFHIAETERKCFIEEIPDETMVVAKYKCQIYDPQTGGFMPSSPGIGMHVEVRDPEDKIMMSKGNFYSLSTETGTNLIQPVHFQHNSVQFGRQHNVYFSHTG